VVDRQLLPEVLECLFLVYHKPEKEWHKVFLADLQWASFGLPSLGQATESNHPPS
jgi:hypothetical protein